LSARQSAFASTSNDDEARLVGFGIGVEEFTAHAAAVARDADRVCAILEAHILQGAEIDQGVGASPKPGKRAAAKRQRRV
jgi:hypothetical protein